MERETEHVVHMSVASIVFASLLAIAIGLAVFGRGILFLKDYRDTFSKEYQTVELINKFDSTDLLSSDGSKAISPKIVSGSDIINLMLTYNNMYTFVIEENTANPSDIGVTVVGDKKYRTYSKEISDKITEAGGDGLEIWTQKYLTDHVIGSNNSNPDYFSSISNKDTGDFIFNFTHDIKYTIHFHGNGNDGGTSTAMNDQEIYYSSGDSLDKNIFTRSGYTFLGWHKNASATRVLVEDQGDGSTLSTTDNGEVDLYAIWVPVPYSISYDYAGGSGLSNPTSYSKNSGNISIGSAYRDGYDFIGWTGSNGSTPQKNVTLASGSEGPKHYTANWKIKDLELTIDTDGGSYSGTNPLKLAYGKTTTLGSISKQGYNFSNWTLASGDGVLNGSKFTMKNNSSTVKANWTPITFTVIFNANSGSGSMPNQKFTYGTSTNLYANTFTKAGYAFNGWAFTASGAAKVDDKALGSKLSTIDGDKFNLYATWKGKEYTLNVNAAGGTIDGVGTKTVKIEHGKTTKLNNPVRAGYTFSGWKLTTANGGTLSGSTVTMGTGDMTVTAQWTQDKYTLDVNYWLNGASASSGSYLKFDVYVNGTKVGDQVSDFCKTSTYEYGTTYEIKNIKNTTGWAYGGVHGSKPLKGTITGNTSVYLIANTSEHKIKFDAQGGNSKEVTYKYGASVGFYTPSYSGWTFLGWYDINDNRVTSATVSGDKTYYAHWSRDFGYTGNIQSVQLPAETNYYMEAWGAQGSAHLDGTAGQGGYVNGYRKIGKTVLYIGVGGQGGYNGGGQQGVSGNGGGATHMAYMSGTLPSIMNSSRKVTQNGVQRTISNEGQVLLVAGGGGGSERQFVRGGYGGTTTGEDAQYTGNVQLGSGGSSSTLYNGPWLSVTPNSYYASIWTGIGLSGGSLDWCTNYGKWCRTSNLMLVENTYNRKIARFYVPSGIPSDSYSNYLDPYSIWEVRIQNPSSGYRVDKLIWLKLNGAESSDSIKEYARYLQQGKGGSQTAGGAGAVEASVPSSNVSALKGSKGQGGSGAGSDYGVGGGGGWYGGGGATYAGGGGGGSSYYQLLKNPHATRGGRTGNGAARITILSPNNKYS